MIIVDTNVVSEMLRESPDPTVVAWLESVSLDDCYATTITEAEMLAGAIILPEGKRRTQLMNAIIGFFQEDFSGRLLAFDSPAASRYADIMLMRRRAGAPISALDAQIAAIASDKGMTIATRNIRDFENCGVDLINPWAS